MSVRAENAGEREWRTFWVFERTTRQIVQADGFPCPSDYWWVPSVGLSMPAALCHDSYEEARLQAIDELRAERASIDKALAEVGGEE